MVAQMHVVSLFVFIVESVNPIDVRIDLMQDHIESEKLAKDSHFKASSPGSIDGDLLNIFVNICVILHLRLIECFVLSQMLDNALSESSVNILLAKKLVSNGSEEAIAIKLSLLDI